LRLLTVLIIGLTTAAACSNAIDPAREGADRVAVITMKDNHFEPDRLEVKRGETVAFRFINRGGTRHDAFIGDEDEQNDHERESRMAAQAFGGQVLATSAVADQARTEGVAVVDLGTFGLKNIAGDVHLFELHIGPRVRGAVIDPVCRMRVEMDDAAGRLRVDGVDHWFCSLECAGKFLRDAGVTIG
jgi:YHS domain-containing protein/plastocyanin